MKVGENPTDLGYGGLIWDEDIGMYMDGAGNTYDEEDGVWAGLHWPTIWGGLGRAGLDAVTLGLYSGIQNNLLADYNDLPEFGVDVWSRTLDAVPIVGGVRGAMMADNWYDRGGAISGTLGVAGLVGAGSVGSVVKGKIVLSSKGGVNIL